MPLALQFITPDEKSTIIPVSYTNNQVIEYSTVNLFTRYLQDIVDGIPVDTSEQQIIIGATGQDLLFDDTQRESEADFIKMDSIVLPASMFVLALYLRNLRLMVIPVLSTGTSLLVSFMIMWIVASYIVVASFAPSVMVSIIIAMSIDYSLFLLTRFREEIIRGAPNVVAVRHMTRYAGHVVLLSGSTLTITFLGLIFFPLNILQSIGIACAIALVISLIVNLTLTPALLLTFPVFFSNFRLVPRRMQRWFRNLFGIKHSHRSKSRSASFLSHHDLVAPLINNENDRHDNQHHVNRLNGHNNTNGNKIDETSDDLIVRDTAVPIHGNANSPHHHHAHHSDYVLPPSDTLYPDDSDQDTPTKQAAVDKRALMRSRMASVVDDLEQKALHDQNSSWWFRTALITTTTKYSVITVLVVIGVIMSVAWKVVDFQTTPDSILVFPDDSRALAVFRQMTQWFPPGTIDPYNIIMTTPDNNGVMTEEFFTAQQVLADRLVDTGLVMNTSIASIAYMHGVKIDYILAKSVLDNPDDPSPAAVTYRTLFNAFVNDNRTAALMIAITSIDPNGYGTTQWIDHVRDILQDSQDHDIQLYQYYLAGGATYNLDIMRSINRGVPVLIGITATVLLLIVGFIFKSILVPIRQLFTIGLSICFVYGLSAFVFQDLNYKNAHAIYWMELVMTFSLLVGLGLDYDVFLFSRVMEYRKLGYTNRASITKAIYKTGPIITAAGLIMALAFGGLMLSSTIVMVQFGFMLCFAVLLDTFIVRTLLVPALLHLSGNLNWWPAVYPPGIYDADHFQYEEIDLEYHQLAMQASASPSPEPESNASNGLPHISVNDRIQNV